MLRSTNTGISAVIDPLGRVVAKTPTFVKTNIESEVGLMNGSPTLYTRVGDVFPAACLVFWIGLAAVVRLSGKNTAQGI
jgi:apolipoprotein N-acyltransferase